MVIEGIAIGWILILLGVVMLLIEAVNPGFFIAVPGTVMIIIGVISLIFPEVFFSQWIIIIGVIVALASAGLTIWLYSKITPEGAPTTVSRDTLIGKEGIVLAEVNVDTIKGKVSIEGVEWSARSEETVIPEGKQIRVIKSEGVHVVIEEV